jgi:hypothetical protein
MFCAAFRPFAFLVVLGASCVAGQSVANDSIQQAQQHPTQPARTSNDSTVPLRYFLDQEPTDLATSTLPKETRNVVVAKVKLVPCSGAGLGGRDQSGRPPREAPEYLVAHDLQIVTVISGSLPSKSNVTVTFGRGDGKHTYILVPTLPRERDREYFVVIFSEAGGRLHLAGFPTSETEYSAWEAEVLAYSIEQAKLPPNIRASLSCWKR